MQKLKIALFTTLLFCAMPLLAHAQKVNSTGGASPHETTSAVVDGNRVTLTYGRPYAKDRKIWGTLVPYGKVWRTGSDEATTLITQKAIVIGDTTIPAGAYTLFTLPNADGTAKLIINKQLGQWGLQYDAKQDLARVDLKKTDLDTPVDQFTMAISRTGELRMMWEKTQYSVNFTVQK